MLDRLEPDRGHVVDRDPEAVRLGDRGRPRLELVRQLVPARPVERNRPDHLPAEVERLHRLQQLAPAPERADTARAAELVRRDREEVTTERLHVDRTMRRSLCSIDDHDRALGVCPLGELLDRVDRAERVRDEIVRNDLDVAARSELVERIQLELPEIVDRDVRELGTGSLGDELPRHEVGVVLELGDDDDVAGAEIVVTPRVRHEIQRLGCAAREDHLAIRRRVDERPYLLTCALVPGSRALGERVDAAMDVRVRVLVELAHRIEDLTRLLRRRSRIEVGERTPVHELVEYREIGAQLVHVERRGRLHGHGSTVPRRIRLLAAGTRARPASQRFRNDAAA